MSEEININQLRNEILAELINLKNESDWELSHIQADKLLCKLLDALGEKKIVTAFEDLEKWYA